MNDTTPETNSAPSSSSSGANQGLIPGAIVLAGILIAGAVMWEKLPSVPNPTVDNPGGVADIANISIEGSPFIGQANAPITIAYWADFQCPFCKAFDVGHPQIPTPAALPEIIKQYVDTGKAKVVFKDLAFLGPDSLTAALYGRAVWDLYPAKYYEWHHAMYLAQDEEHGGFGDEPSIVALIQKIPGIDAARVTKATKDKQAEYEALIAADRSDAQEVGISSTPSVLIGTKVITGAQPFSAFKSAIEALL